MSAPNYQSSNEDTIAPANTKAYGASGNNAHDDDLHRYVTDDQPRQPKMGIAEGAGAPPRQVKGAGQPDALMVSLKHVPVLLIQRLI